MKKISPVDFKPKLVSTMKSALEAASAHIDNSSGKPATPGDKNKDGIAHRQDAPLTE